MSSNLMQNFRDAGFNRRVFEVPKKLAGYRRWDRQNAGQFLRAQASAEGGRSSSETRGLRTIDRSRNYVALYLSDKKFVLKSSSETVRR